MQPEGNPQAVPVINPRTQIAVEGVPLPSFYLGWGLEKRAEVVKSDPLAIRNYIADRMTASSVDFSDEQIERVVGSEFDFAGRWPWLLRSKPISWQGVYDHRCDWSARAIVHEKTYTDVSAMRQTLLKMTEGIIAYAENGKFHGDPPDPYRPLPMKVYGELLLGMAGTAGVTMALPPDVRTSGLGVPLMAAPFVGAIGFVIHQGDKNWDKRINERIKRYGNAFPEEPLVIRPKAA